MLDDHIYTKEEIHHLIKNISIKDGERFQQICYHDKFIPYLISTCGRVFSIHYANKRNNIRQLKTKISQYGYEWITITYNRELAVSSSIHRLVAQAFIDNDNAELKIEVNHKDGNKLNNNVSNLEWCTTKYNIQHAFLHNLRGVGENNSTHKYPKAQIENVCKLLSKGVPIHEIETLTSVNIYIIEDVLNRKIWREVSCKYRFEKYKNRVSLNEYEKKLAIITKICILLEENRSIKSIIDETGANSNMVFKILKKRSWREISDNYDFSKYNHGRSYDYYDKLYKKLHDACKYAEKGIYKLTEISKMTGLSYRVIQHLVYGDSYRDISSQYNLSKYRKNL